MVTKLHSICVGLLVVGLGSSQSQAQLIYDLNPTLGHQEVYGYQQTVSRPANPIATNQVAAPVATGGASAGAPISGGMTAYGLAGGNPAQAVTIYNPVAVAGLTGSTVGGVPAQNWPPRGGPWGMRSAAQTSTEAPPLESDLGLTLPTDEALPEETSTEEALNATRRDRIATYPAAVPTPSVGAARGGEYGRSPLEPFLPPLVSSLTVYNGRDDTRARSNASEPQSTERGAAGLSSVYRQVDQEQNQDEELPDPADESVKPSTPRQLAPIYQQAKSQ